MTKALGRGLDAILPKYSNLDRVGSSRIVGKDEQQSSLVSIEKIRPNKYQARRHFNEERLKELASSIKSHGLAQPIIVSPSLIFPGEYELVAGERRLRAAKLAGLKEVPVIIRETDDKSKFHLSLAENIQREDLNPIEEALAYKNLMKEFGYTQEELARVIGKDRSVVANSLRLLNLPEEIQTLIEEGAISAAHGRTLAALSGDTGKQKELLKKIMDGRLTVREVEQIVGEMKKTSSSKNKKFRRLAPEIAHLESNLESVLHTKVRISGGIKKGKIIIHYYSLEDLERLSRALKRLNFVR